jgi:transcription antitermination factor NusA-like protein
MKSTLKKVSEIVAKANDSFYNQFDNVDTLMGMMDKNLRNQGMKADAITIDCIAQNKKIVVLIHDDKPDTIEIALGSKEGDIYSSAEFALNELSEAVIIDIMEKNFISQENHTS